MQSSFKAFLTECKLGELSLGDSKSSVLSRIGEPSWWEGRKTLNCEKSDVWAYGDLGIVFENDCIAKLEIVFRNTGNSSHPQFPCNISVSDFTVHSRTTIDEFAKYLSDRGIPYDEQAGDFRATLVRIIPKGAVAIFRHTLDYERSVAEEKRIQSEEKHLFSIEAKQQWT